MNVHIPQFAEMTGTYVNGHLALRPVPTSLLYHQDRSLVTVVGRSPSTDSAGGQILNMFDTKSQPTIMESLPTIMES